MPMPKSTFEELRAAHIVENIEAIYSEKRKIPNEQGFIATRKLQELLIANLAKRIAVDESVLWKELRKWGT